LVAVKNPVALRLPPVRPPDQFPVPLLELSQLLLESLRVHAELVFDQCARNTANCQPGEKLGLS
jgi:hypothetical protein